ncbi:MAG TPA: undecaprenyl-diphosphate phosphatase [Polyangia bacterium]|jgi:undecaprenyl-diphosphatase|nr:undecaprenyl-diphosphate phosphatase [Polyangia bacterium]
MNIIEAVVLGVVQGVTEFLPISSTAHLRVVPALAGWDDPGAAFTAVLQLGSLAAVIGYFMRDLVGMVASGKRWLADRSQPPEPPARMLGYIVIGTIPVGIAGILLKHKVEGSFRALWVIAAAQIVVGLALAIVERTARKSRDFDDITLRDAVIIGCAQMLALVPGVSRSGITLMAAMGVGLERPAAARFSFLLSVPAVAAAGVFELPKVLRAHDISGFTLTVGLIAAVVASYASIAWLLKFLRTRTTIPFVVYRVALGALIFAMLAMGRL